LVNAADPNLLLDVFLELEAEQVFGPWTGMLSNSGEQIRLVDLAGETVDKVKSGDWADRREASNNE